MANKGLTNFWYKWRHLQALANKPNLGDKFDIEITGHGGCLWAIPVFVGCLWAIPVIGSCLWAIPVIGDCLWAIPVIGGCLWAIPVIVISMSYLSLFLWLIPAQASLKLAYWRDYQPRDKFVTGTKFVS